MLPAPSVIATGTVDDVGRWLRAWLTAGVAGASLAAWAQVQAQAPAQVQAPAPCSLLSAAEITGVSAVGAGPYTADAPADITSAEIPGLPTSLRMQECTGIANAAGVIGFRISLLSAPRALTAAEWKTVLKRLDDTDPPDPAARETVQQVGQNRCWQLSQPLKGIGPRAGSQSHEVACNAERGRHLVTVEFAHTDKARLPTPAQVAGLLERAVQRLR